MTIEELIFAANKTPYIYLALERKTPPRSGRIRLAGRSGPLGRVCNVKEAEEHFEVVAVFKSSKVLEYLKCQT